MILLLLLWTLACSSCRGWVLDATCAQRRPPHALRLFPQGRKVEHVTNNATAEAETLRRRAKELLAEARSMEVSLQDSRSASKSRKDAESAALINKLFGSEPLTVDSIADILRRERWSTEQAIYVVDALFERYQRASLSTTQPSSSSLTPSSAWSRSFQIADTRNAARVLNETEANATLKYYESLVAAAERIDVETNNRGDHVPSADSTTRRNARWSSAGTGAAALKSRWKELRRAHDEAFQRRLAANLAAAVQSTNVSSVENYMRTTLGLPPVENKEDQQSRQFNMTRAMEQVVIVPRWLPTSMIDYIVASRSQVQSDDISLIASQVLTGSGFFCTKTESIPSAAIFRGNIRGSTAIASDQDQHEANLTAVVFEEIERRMEAEGLSDRLQVFLLPDPEWKPGQDPCEITPRPVLLAVSKLVQPDDSMIRKGGMVQNLLKRSAPALAIITTFSYAVSCYALNPAFFDAIVSLRQAAPLAHCVPMLLGIFSLQALQEVIHIRVARRRGMKIGNPILLPSPQIGTFGCITALRSFPKNRADLLDFALSGPMAMWLASILLMVIGANQTVGASEAALAGFPYVPVGLLKTSFAAGALLTWLAPKTMLLPLSQPIPISPLFMIGFSGMFAASVNLLPIFRLDGGRACNAATGTRFAAFVSASTLMFLLSLALSSNSGIAFIWGIMVVLFQRRPEIPVRNDVTEIDRFRFRIWLASLVAPVLSIVPFPGGPGFL